MANASSLPTTYTRIIYPSSSIQLELYTHPEIASSFAVISKKHQCLRRPETWNTSHLEQTTPSLQDRPRPHSRGLSQKRPRGRGSRQSICNCITAGARTTNSENTLLALRDATNRRHQPTRRSPSPAFRRSSRRSCKSLAPNQQDLYFEQKYPADLEIKERIPGNPQHRSAENADRAIAAVEGRVRELSLQPDYTSVEEPPEFFSLKDLLEYNKRKRTCSRCVQAPVYNPLTDRWTVHETYVPDGSGGDLENYPALQEIIDALGWTKGPEEIVSVKR